MDQPEITPSGHLLTKEQQSKVAAMQALTVVDRDFVHGLSLQSAVRALIATHPDPQSLRLVFDQIYEPLLAGPPFTDRADLRVAHDVFGTILFAPYTLR